MPGRIMIVIMTRSRGNTGRAFLVLPGAHERSTTSPPPLAVGRSDGAEYELDDRQFLLKEKKASDTLGHRRLPPTQRAMVRGAQNMRRSPCRRQIAGAAHCGTK